MVFCLVQLNDIERLTDLIENTGCNSANWQLANFRHLEKCLLKNDAVYLI